MYRGRHNTHNNGGYSPGTDPLTNLEVYNKPYWSFDAQVSLQEDQKNWTEEDTARLNTSYPTVLEEPLEDAVHTRKEKEKMVECFHSGCG